MTPDELYEAQKVARLIAGHISGTLNDLEVHDLDDWISENDENMLLFEKLTDPDNIAWAKAWFTQLDIEQKLLDTLNKVSDKARYHQSYTVDRKPKKNILIMRWASAAAVFFISAFLIIRFLLPGHDHLTRQLDNADKAESKRAIILVADGQEINLSNKQNQQIPIGNDTITNSNNILSYDKDRQTSVIINTLRVPAGKDYQVVLADGTKVWINASSSLTYPSAFVEKTRTVELNGEGYFEVAHDPAKPFIVKSNGTDIMVKGTHFNVRGYRDEEKQTVSLLEGKVELSNGSQTKLLAPNEEGIISGSGITVKPVENITDAVAWTKGMFSFRMNSIEEVMQQVARWYDVQVSYQDNINKQFTGQIYRNSTLQQVLHMLELTGGVHFIVKENTVTVLQK